MGVDIDDTEPLAIVESPRWDRAAVAFDSFYLFSLSFLVTQIAGVFG